MKFYFFIILIISVSVEAANKSTAKTKDLKTHPVGKDVEHDDQFSEVDKDDHNFGHHAWNYKQNGADWPNLTQGAVVNNECGGSNQSPIDLKTTWEKRHHKFDNFNKVYTNQVQDIVVEWNGHTSQTIISKENQDLQTFESYAVKRLYGGNKRYTGVQFHFHHGSEHTVDGQRHDLEMHTVHLADKEQNKFFAAAMGIIFSVNNYTKEVEPWEEKIIDNFFDSLKWEDLSGKPVVAHVPYGELMMMVDMDNRWVYKGSVTTPPCRTNVFWNIVQTIYPIKQKHLNLFKGQLKRGGLLKTGNWRVIQNLTEGHAPMIISEDVGALASMQKIRKDMGEPLLAAIVAVVALAAVTVVLTVMYLLKTSGDKDEEKTPNAN